MVKPEQFALSLQLEALGQKTVEKCACCDNRTRIIWGALHNAHGTVGIYYVHWSADLPDSPIGFDFIMGQFGENSDPKKRVGVSAKYQLSAQPTCTIVDGSKHLREHTDFVGRVLSSDEVNNSKLAQIVIDCIKMISSTDTRL